MNFFFFKSEELEALDFADELKDLLLQQDELQPAVSAVGTTPDTATAASSSSSFASGTAVSSEFTARASGVDSGSRMPLGSSSPSAQDVQVVKSSSSTSGTRSTSSSVV